MQVRVCYTIHSFLFYMENVCVFGLETVKKNNYVSEVNRTCLGYKVFICHVSERQSILLSNFTYIFYL